MFNDSIIEECVASSLSLSSGACASIVHLLSDDLDAMWRVEQSASHYHWSNQNLKSSVDGDDLCLGVRLGERLCAQLIIAKQYNVLEVLILSVAEDYQRQGIAQALLEVFLSVVKGQYQHHGQYQSVLLEVRESNNAAINLYKKLGFVGQGRRKNYYPVVTASANKREDAILMSFALA